MHEFCTAYAWQRTVQILSQSRSLHFLRELDSLESLQTPTAGNPPPDLKFAGRAGGGSGECVQDCETRPHKERSSPSPLVCLRSSTELHTTANAQTRELGAEITAVEETTDDGALTRVCCRCGDAAWWAWSRRETRRRWLSV